MERNSITTLAVKFWATIETPPLNTRETFRQSVIDTVMNVLKLQDPTVEYIGYKPDNTGIQNTNLDHMVYEDCVFVSLNIPPVKFQQQLDTGDNLIAEFVRVFEDKTHKHLEIDSVIVNKEKKQRIIELTSDWKYFRKQG